MHVLHITSWYPNQRALHESPFVERHVKALDLHGINTVWHIDVRHGPKWRMERRSPKAHRTFLLFAPLRITRLVEWSAALLVLWAWFTRDRRVRYDAVNFYIAYPNCVHIGSLRRFIRVPVLITEQYSAYRIDFNSSAAGVGRIRRIFTHGIPIVSVSKALGRDIERFAQAGPLEVHVVPNVVDTDHFGPDPGIQRTEGRFFALAYWRAPKRPDVLIEVAALLRDRGRPVHIRIGGDGPQLDALRERIEQLGVQEHIELLGRLGPAEAAREMRAAHAFLHASDYETYSAVCVEALGCGTPVIASAVGGIVEYMDKDRGALVASNEPAAWADAIDRSWTTLLRMDRLAISQRMLASGSPHEVGRKFHAVIKGIIEQNQRAGTLND